MTFHEREGLIARIRHIRRVAAATEKPVPDAPSSPDSALFRIVEARIAHLEQMVQGLQDSVHRESERQERLIADIQEQIQPAAMSAALSKDARDRGL